MPSWHATHDQAATKLNPGLVGLLDCSDIPDWSPNQFTVELEVKVTSPYRLHHACITRQGYDALAAGKSSPNALLAPHQAADAVNNGLITTEHIIASYSSSLEEDDNSVEDACHVDRYLSFIRSRKWRLLALLSLEASRAAWVGGFAATML